MNVIVDVQGFKNEENKFIVKEIAILSKTCSTNLLIKPPYPFYNLTTKERLQVSWIERNLGILWNEGFIPFNMLKLNVMDFFRNKHVYTKGVEKVKWLKKLLDNNNVYNLEDLNCPKFETLYNLYPENIQTCIYHKKICALKNVLCLYKWCKEQKFDFMK